MKNDNDIVVVSGARTAIGKFGGSLVGYRAYQLAAIAMEEAIRRAGVEKSIFDDVVTGDCCQVFDEANTSRTAMLAIGMPVEIPACTIQRQCSSSMQALMMAAQQIKAGDSEVVLISGTESMSNAPYYLPNARWGQRLMHGKLLDAVWEMLHSGSNLLEKEGYIMGVTAENLAEKYNISRKEQDEVALRSQNNAEKATNEGRFKDEIVGIEIKDRKGKVVGVFDKDEHFRPGLTMEQLEKLPTTFKKDGTVTAGNASGLNDGACAAVVMSRKKAQELGCKPLFKVLGQAVAGVEPHLMGYGPVPSTEKLMKKFGFKLSDFQLIELNEAFAAQYLACEKGLGIDREITNVNGSGIGLGHPVGCTGLRIIISLYYEMKKRNLTTGLATLCVGGGMGMSTAIEVEG